jgi:uncharacterized cupredoxin-like copper-binding protein
VRLAPRLALVAAVTLAVVGAGFAIDATLDDAAGADDGVLGPGVVTVEVGIHHSVFSIDELRVARGTLVRFVVDNDDPIHHELIVGDESVHLRHRTGEEIVHPPVPGEVSVGPGERALTMYEFDEAGVVTFACHLPRHFEYGMHGEIEVVPSPR